MKSLRPFALALLLPLTLQAQEINTENKHPPTQLPAKKNARSSRVNIDSSRFLRLNYGYPKWNKSPTAIDSASILMRDGRTGRLVQIQLEETEPDSSVFTGLFSVQWESITQFTPDFHIPPQELLSSPQGLKKLSEMIQRKELKRVPFILRRIPGGEQSIELFDTRAQARTALQAYRAELEALEIQKEKVVAESAIAAAKIAADAKAREEAAKAASERARLDQIEERKKKEREELFRKQAETEQKRRREEAARFAQEALEQYRNQQFDQALKKFEKSLELDPRNTTYYFQYGVTLYRTENFNRALVFLNMAEGADVNLAEKEYYRGLSYFRLKEYKNAIEAFRKAEAAKHLELSPSASFYIGMIHFEEKRYGEAKDQFQLVLDTSKDPRLDERADTMIEQILRLQQFEAERARKWTLTGTIGVSYDSNILQVSASQLDTGVASDAAGWRFLQQGSVRYRPMFETDREFAAQLDIINMYTVDNSFKFNQNLRNTDPFVATLSLPYTYKGLLGGKGYKVDIAPGYETIFMSVEDNTNKEILNSYILNILNTIVMSDGWFTNYNIEIRQDNSKLESSTGDDDATAVKAKLTFGNYFFMDQDKKKIVTADLGYTSNAAKGDNVVYNRIDLSVGYVGQTFWDMTWNAKLAYFLLDYPKNSTSRTDNSYTASLSLSKKLNDTYSTGLMTSYNLNDSNVEAYRYNRLSALLTLSAGIGL